MTLLPNLKLKTVVSFPGAVYSGAGVAVRKTNGQFYFDLDYTDFLPPVLFPPAPPNTNVLVFNDVTGTYYLTPFVGSGASLVGPQTFSGLQTFSGPVNFTSTFSVNGDEILRHAITPSADNDPGTNIALGKGAGASLAPIHSTQYLTAVGFMAANSLTTADHITALGAWALASYTGGAASITAIGIDALRNATSGQNLVAVGEHSMTGVIAGGQFSTAIGQGSGYYMGGNYNTAIGSSACLGVIGAPLSGQGNTGVGAGSMVTVQGAAQLNTAVGYFSLVSLTTGSNNVSIGYDTGATLTTGVGNILIGTQADVPTAATSNYLNLGGIITGDLAGALGTNIKGTAANNNAAAGFVGEYIESIVASGSAIGLANNAPNNIASIPLGAGDWDVEFICQFTGGATTVVSALYGSISQTSAALDLAAGRTIGQGFPSGFVMFGSAVFQSIPVPPVRKSLSGPTTIYGVAQGIFATSTLSAFGILRARRVR